MIRIIFSLAIFSTLSYPALSQATPHMKFGKPLKQEVSMTKYEADTAASAVVLVDYGESRIVWDQSQGFQLLFERYTRIKILKNEGYNWADVSIPLYETDGSRERIGSLKGNTYNLEGGQVQKTKLEKSSVFSEQTSDHWSQQKFTMPNVKEGSVIEYSYTISSDFLFQFRDWSFQQTIPTAWSEYKAIIPEYFDYKQLSQGYVPITIKESDTAPGSYNYTTSTRGFQGSGARMNTSKIEFVYNKFRWAVRDVPAFKEERFITSIEDHVSRIRFELATIKYPGQPAQKVMDTWETLDRKMKENDHFGDAIKKDGFIKDQIASIVANSSSKEEIIENTMSFVQQKMHWNGIRTKYVESTLKNAYEKREGNAADINLLLVAMLRKAGIDANPVILSTRDNGQVLTFYPIISRFNYVIVEASAGDQTYLLDATDKYCPLNTLPYRALNSTGRRISENSGWVDLTHGTVLSDTRTFALTLSSDGTLDGTLVESKKGYTAANLRDKIKEEGQEEVVENKFENQQGWKLNDYKIDNLESKEKPLVSKFQITISETAESVGDLIYLNPVLPSGLKENPFKVENRDYPVDMGCPYKQTYMVTLALPEGYQVDELPEPGAIRMPDASATFVYNIQQVGNSINLTSQLNVKKAIYQSEEYANLKEFFNAMVDKHSQQIVLKKI